MKGQVFNPYLPAWEHIPDGEPRVFGDRLYVYGSHDRSHGSTFCMDDYVCWSAPLDDLSTWRCEGTIWRKQDDPDNLDPVGYLYAPDVIQGPDGRYYLYYFTTAGQKRPYQIGVAVCDTPSGHFSYYGKIEADNSDSFIAFDPSIFIDDDGRVWLYYGSAFSMGENVFKPLGGAVVELARDMKSVLSKPKLTVPNMFHMHQFDFRGHPFFEASSMRKINGIYYLVYSSQLSHELCYAVSNKPDGKFVYGGTIISNGDIGLNGRKKSVYPTGNNHGGLVWIKGQWYVFYHRHTQGTSFSRQGCAEPITIKENGSIPQVEITSCGLNGCPLPGKGWYPAHICCHLTPGKKTKQLCVQEEWAENQRVAFVSGLTHGAKVGYKYFSFDHATQIRLCWRVSLGHYGYMQQMTPQCCTVNGRWIVRCEENGPVLSQVRVEGIAGDWQELCIPIKLHGIEALYFEFAGKGAVDLLGFQVG